RRGRPDELAAELDGPQDGYRPGPRPAGGGAAGRRVLVPVRLAAGVRGPDRMGAAEPADGSPADDRRGPRPGGGAGDALPQRLPGQGRSQLGPAARDEPLTLTE